MQIQLKDTNQEQVFNLHSSLCISIPLAKILVSRGKTDPCEANAYLYPELSDMHNPFLLSDITKAVLRVKKAIEKRENILIYGDKDVDGQISVSLLKKILKSNGVTAQYYVPVEEGYGLHESIIEYLKKKNIKLLITVDCGSSNADEISAVNHLGIDVIVIDHHEIAVGLPDAYAVVNPKRNDSEYPFYDLAGCAVVFKFGQALNFSTNYFFNKKLLFVDTENTGIN
ncbi:DHH family phosphoesterase, partial [bacterium]